MRAVTFDSFSATPVVTDVPEPACPPHAAVVRVVATGVCRSDWHAWHGHDDTVALPHVPGHEFVGVVERVGDQVRQWQPGTRVTAPFVNACGACPTCIAGRQSICPNQTQPGFDRPGSFAEQVVVHHADTNLVAVPDAIDDATAAGLGCRFATAYRAVVNRARTAAGEHVVVFGCGGVGLSAIVVAVSRGARVVAVDVSAEALALARTLGATTTVDARSDDVDEQIRVATDGGAHVVVEALGRAPSSARASPRSARVVGTCRSDSWRGRTPPRRSTSAGSSDSSSNCSAATGCPRTSTRRCSPRSPTAGSTPHRWSVGRSRSTRRRRRSRRWTGRRRRRGRRSSSCSRIRGGREAPDQPGTGLPSVEPSAASISPDRCPGNVVTMPSMGVEFDDAAAGALIRATRSADGASTGQSGARR